jgi:hypothetical protein
MKPQLIVLTPVKNEAPILDRFLSVTSLFADQILIADQSSTDASRQICSNYKKVTLIENSCDNYCEAERQILLISTARKLWPGPKILLGLDADEVLAANAIHTEDWQRMLSAPPSTILCFERPDLMPGLETWVKSCNPKPLGFVDDEIALHDPLQIHSPRVPQPTNAVRLLLPNIKILHYGPARMRAQFAKSRFYSVQENLKKTNPLRRRRKWYGYMVKKYYQQAALNSQKIPSDWFSDWQLAGIDMCTLPIDDLISHEVEVLRAFAHHGERRFWLEPIWDIDWNELRHRAKGIEGISFKDIKTPPLFHKAYAVGLDLFIKFLDFILWVKAFRKK